MQLEFLTLLLDVAADELPQEASFMELSKLRGIIVSCMEFSSVQVCRVSASVLTIRICQIFLGPTSEPYELEHPKFGYTATQRRASL